MASRGPGGWIAASLLAAAGVAGVLSTVASGGAAAGLVVVAVLLAIAALPAGLLARRGRGRQERDGAGDLVARGGTLAWDARTVAAPSPGRLTGVLDLLCRAVGADSAILLAPVGGEEEDAFRVVACAPPDDEHLLRDRFSASVGLVGAIRRAGETSAVVVGDRPPRSLPYATEDRVVAHALGHPVVLSAGVGVLVVERRRDAPFAAAQATVLQSSADIVAWFFDTEDVFSRALHRVAALECVADAAHSLATAGDAEDISRRTIDAAQTLVPVDEAVVALLDATSGQLRIVAVEGCDLPLGASCPLDAGLAGRAAELRETLPAQGRQPAAGGRPFGESIAWDPAPGAALALVPLVGGDALVGILALTTAESPRYDRGQQLLLRSLANLAGAELVRREMERSLEALARTDALTGLANRRAFGEALEAALGRSERYGHPTSLLMLDLDHFKSVNDEHGHATGDLVLRGVAQTLLGLARGVDVCARVGGEELAVILEHAGIEGAHQVAERIRERVVRRPFPSATGTFHVTVSVGVATWGAHGRDAATLLSAADTALYAAKHGGRNRVKVARGA